ncbi:hypothetical protein HELRODRAFT_103742 [Helobdella robusta]|uniref:DNA helicase n=1 Tax=Helobdella robusta TaxID=6412 RepID=T1EDH2_HELRO|nr:hypothetical protein HELRODRAFT_103742 [Helobdella robusta]ESN92387.1 hypothetical protein HELRODRAFT_103742 [Helobdella robusta]
MKDKLEKNKNLGKWIISECKVLLEIRDNIRSLMEKCQKISTNLESSIFELLGGEQLTNKADDLTSLILFVNLPSLSLTPYQLVGLNWLIMMHQHKLNGILGDEMGLGKTIQTIAFLAYLLEKGDEGPHVIISPSSTIDNWLRELQKWCPSLKVLPYYGSQEERRHMRHQLMKAGSDVNVILTSYNMASGSVEDRVLFKKFNYRYAVFDEGHMLKNMHSNRYKSLMKISSERRLLLTGTPLQNNLLELMSLLSFLMPDIFAGKTDNFRKIFSMSSGSSNDIRGTYEQETLVHAKRILQPFFLRRLKINVLKQLPKKSDHVIKVSMSHDQGRLYEKLRKHKGKSGCGSDVQSSGASMLMQLRKSANHELLHRALYNDDLLMTIAKRLIKDSAFRNSDVQCIFEDLQVMSDFEIHTLVSKHKVTKEYKLEESVICRSGKFAHLDEVLPEMKIKGDRILLFSQFTMMLDIIEVYLEFRGYKYLRLDGSTPVTERQELIDKFTDDDDIFIFLLSTKAGGMGINLTAANVVVLHDIDFNPYNDKQAEDRCHRVGQTRDVKVYRLITKNSIEEAMLRCAQDKLKLERDVTGNSTDVNEEANTADVASLLKEALKMR